MLIFIRVRALVYLSWSFKPSSRNPDLCSQLWLLFCVILVIKFVLDPVLGIVIVICIFIRISVVPYLLMQSKTDISTIEFYTPA